MFIKVSWIPRVKHHLKVQTLLALDTCLPQCAYLFWYQQGVKVHDGKEENDLAMDCWYFLNAFIFSRPPKANDEMWGRTSWAHCPIVACHKYKEPIASSGCNFPSRCGGQAFVPSKWDIHNAFILRFVIASVTNWKADKWVIIPKDCHAHVSQSAKSFELCGNTSFICSSREEPFELPSKEVTTVENQSLMCMPLRRLVSSGPWCSVTAQQSACSTWGQINRKHHNP